VSPTRNGQPAARTTETDRIEGHDVEDPDRGCSSDGRCIVHIVKRNDDDNHNDGTNFDKHNDGTNFDNHNDSTNDDNHRSSGSSRLPGVSDR
jgi:hypothetical protein